MTMANTQEKILLRLKTRGPQSIKILADQLGVTSMGIRQHMAELERQDLVMKTQAARQTRGRPVHYWKLSDHGHSGFADRHGDAAVALILSVRNELGENGLDTVVKSAHNSLRRRYRQALEQCAPDPEPRLQCLAELRSEDGFMAEIRLLPDGWLLIENHCPQSAMASACPAYCEAELELFRSVLGSRFSVQRSEHLLSNNRRCAFRIQEC